MYQNVEQNDDKLAISGIKFPEVVKTLNGIIYAT